MKSRIILIVLFGITAIGMCGAGYYLHQPETEYQVQYIERWHQAEPVEKPIYIAKPVYDIVEKPVYITANITHETQVVSEELNLQLLELMAEIKGKGFIPWKNKDEIRYWLKYTAIPMREYIKEIYDCDDFALSLYYAGLLDGRPIGMLWDYKDRHVMNFTIMGHYYIPIEPQTGNLFERIRIDYGFMP